MVKAVIFCRVSSTAQNYERQVDELMSLALKDGYLKEEIAITAHKESATKNDVANRKTISDLKKLISDNSIETVYVSEISRLSRRQDVMYSVLSLLEDNRICLTIQNPMLIRTIVDGKSNPMAHIAISFLTYAAINESEIKSERTRSGKAKGIKEGKIVNGTVKFGYSRSKDNKPVINPEEAKVVIDIFNMYLNGSTSGEILNKYSFLFKGLKKESIKNRICRILVDNTYIGKNAHYPYPQIVDEDIFNKVGSMLSENKIAKVKKASKNIWYCRGLVTYEGRILSPDSYHCRYRITDSEYSASINVNVIESLAWGLAVEAKAIEMQVNNGQELNRLKEEKERLLSTLKVRNDEMEENKKSSERLVDLYVLGKIPKDRFEATGSKIEGEYGHLMSEMESIEKRLAEIDAFLDRDSDSPLKDIVDYNQLADITDDATRAAIVQETIKELKLTKTEEGYFIDPIYVNDYCQKEGVRYFSSTKQPKLSLYCVFDDYYDDWSASIERRYKKG